MNIVRGGRAVKTGPSNGDARSRPSLVLRLEFFIAASQFSTSGQRRGDFLFGADVDHDAAMRPGIEWPGAAGGHEGFGGEGRCEIRRPGGWTAPAAEITSQGPTPAPEVKDRNGRNCSGEMGVQLRMYGRHILGGADASSALCNAKRRAASGSISKQRRRGVQSLARFARPVRASGAA